VLRLYHSILEYFRKDSGDREVDITAVPAYPLPAIRADPPPPEKNERLSYLLDMYKLYHGHINTMFNYFLILSGLIANAYIQSMLKTAHISRALSASIAAFGALMSIVSLLIHLRSRTMMDIIERGLKAEEEVVFLPRNYQSLSRNDQARIYKGFLTEDSYTWRLWYQRHKYQFPITYWAFVLAFAAMAVYASQTYIENLIEFLNCLGQSGGKCQHA
jgi:hypothetical protein